jgi:hypothetical protein
MASGTDVDRSGNAEARSLVIVVDGRTDEEKLHELLAAGAEEAALDFKASLDLSGKASKDSVEFAKDAISMGNLPAGGYLVIGVDDQGAPAHAQPPVAAEQFDSATLRAKVARYVEAPVHVVSQAHKVDGRTIVLIYVAPNPDGLPVPTSSIGQYAKSDGTMGSVFGEGEVLTREGTSNVRLRYAHWHGLLDRYRNVVRAEARRDADDLIRQVVEGLRAGGSNTAPSVPLAAGMDHETLAEALVALFESGSTVRVQQFLNNAALRSGTGTPEDRETRLGALDQITVVACQAVLYRQDDIYRLAIAALERAYKARLPTPNSIQRVGNEADRAQHYLDVLIRVLAIGALVVRRQAWELLPDLSNRPVKEGGYEWLSWLRHAVTMASRARLLQDDEGNGRGGQALSLARALVAASPALRPDYGTDTELPKPDVLADDDWLLNSLCEFDLWWCILAFASRPSARDGAAYYPSCAAFHQWRAQPTLIHIATEPAVRQAAFGPAADELIAKAMLTVVRTATVQSYQYGGWWNEFADDPRVAKYVTDHATED